MAWHPGHRYDANILHHRPQHPHWSDPPQGTHDMRTSAETGSSASGPGSIHDSDVGQMADATVLPVSADQDVNGIEHHFFIRSAPAPYCGESPIARRFKFPRPAAQPLRHRCSVDGMGGQASRGRAAAIRLCERRRRSDSPELYLCKRHPQQQRHFLQSVFELLDRVEQLPLVLFSLLPQQAISTGSTSSRSCSSTADG